ncbi:C2 domain-containing protein [Salix suchowensis]|nr:C2 domain-containing protein [Salix suchowensis]
MKDSAAKFRELKVSCWSKEPRTDEKLGEGNIDITETLKTGEFDDWISLSIPEVGARGEVYLEMTFYAAAPMPASSNRLSAAPGAQLLRRPSKFSQADRLSRPATKPSPLSTNGSKFTQPDNRIRQELSPLRNNQLASGHVSPPHPRSTSVSPQRLNAPLPEEPDRIQSPHPIYPSSGAGRAKPTPQPVQPTSLPTGALPAILRPGNPNAPARTPVPAAAPQEHAPSHNPGPPSTQFALPIEPQRQVSYGQVTGNPYAEPHIRPQSQHANTGYGSPPVHAATKPVPQAVPELWRTYDASAPLSFPVPAAPSVRESYLHHSPPASHTLGPRSPGPTFTPPHSWGREPRDVQDIYRQTRYQSPLPLPPSPPTVGPIPPLAQIVQPAAAAAPARRSSTDAALLEAHRKVEREAAQRKEQEDKDLELARQLDRELNL